LAGGIACWHDYPLADVPAGACSAYYHQPLLCFHGFRPARYEMHDGLPRSGAASSLDGHPPPGPHRLDLAKLIVAASLSSTFAHHPDLTHGHLIPAQPLTTSYAPPFPHALYRRAFRTGIIEAKCWRRHIAAIARFRISHLHQPEDEPRSTTVPACEDGRQSRSEELHGREVRLVGRTAEFSPKILLLSC